MFVGRRAVEQEGGVAGDGERWGVPGREIEGQEDGDLILAGVYAIKFGLTVGDLAATWAPYLTMGEALRLTAQSFTRDVQQLSCCAA